MEFHLRKSLPVERPDASFPISLDRWHQNATRQKIDPVPFWGPTTVFRSLGDWNMPSLRRPSFRTVLLSSRNYVITDFNGRFITVSFSVASHQMECWSSQKILKLLRNLIYLLKSIKWLLLSPCLRHFLAATISPDLASFTNKIQFAVR